MIFAVAKKLPTRMYDTPSVLTTPDLKNAVIVYEGKVYQVLSDDGEFQFNEVMQFSSIEREAAVAFLLPQDDNIFEGC